MRAWNWLLVLALMGFGVSACGGNGGNGDGGTEECGNGEIEGTEECDDGDNNSDTAPDACRSDCTDPICGDSVVDTGEECDDGNMDDGDGCESCMDTAVCGDDEVQGNEECEPGIDDDCHEAGHVRECRFIRSAFRMKSLQLIDPTIKFWPGCNDGIHPLVNDALGAATREDQSSSFATPQDGLIDLGFVFTFGPQNQGDGESSNAAFVISDCDRIFKPSPVPNPSPCSPTITQDPSSTAFTVTTQAAGTCLAEIPDTTQSNTTVNPVEAGDFGCMASDPFVFDVVLGGVVQIPLSDVIFAAQWDDDPASNIVSGLIRGFLTETDAENTQIDPSTLFIGGQTLKQTFGFDESMGDCDERDDNGGTSGYWVYLGFTAEAVPWEGGVMCGNGVLDEEVEVGFAVRDELCDTGIESGEGACDPLLTCDDGFACTEDTINAGDACAPRCFFRAFQDSEDGCCPELAPEGTDVLANGSGRFDQDCRDLCDNGTLESFENCDTTEGTACDDPDELCADDGDACTVETGNLRIIGGAMVQNLCVDCPEGSCECVVTTIGQRIPDDGCCPQSCINNPDFPGCAEDTDCD